MVAMSLIKEKISRIRTEIEREINLRNKELLEERILVLEELMLESVKRECHSINKS